MLMHRFRVLRTPNGWWRTTPTCGRWRCQMTSDYLSRSHGVAIRLAHRLSTVCR